jgi:hypothetical protein
MKYVSHEHTHTKMGVCQGNPANFAKEIGFS